LSFNLNFFLDIFLKFGEENPFFDVASNLFSRYGPTLVGFFVYRF